MLILGYVATSPALIFVILTGGEQVFIALYATTDHPTRCPRILRMLLLVIELTFMHVLVPAVFVRF